MKSPFLNRLIERICISSESDYHLGIFSCIYFLILSENWGEGEYLRIGGILTEGKNWKGPVESCSGSLCRFLRASL